MMGYPAARAIVNPGRLTAASRQPPGIVNQRLMQLGQIGDLCWPIIHLRIDIQCVIAAPRRPGILVPDALEVRRLCAGTELAISR